MKVHSIIAPTGPPRDVTPSTTSRSVSVSWSTIECIEHNGEITNYTVVFQEQGGAVIPGEVNVTNRTFTASGLTPHSNYIFRVAGVNSNGTGPLSNIIVILTDEDCRSDVMDCINWQISTKSEAIVKAQQVHWCVCGGGGEGGEGGF